MNRHRLPLLFTVSLAASGLGVGAVAAASSDTTVPAAEPTAAAAPATAVAPSVPPSTVVIDEVVTADDGIVRNVTVTGRSSIKVAPDTATIELGVETLAPNGAEVMETLATDSETLLQALIAEGIAEEDIQTSSINLWPEYNERGDDITGYRGSLSMSVTVHDLDSVGPTLDLLQRSVGDTFRINGLYFSYSDPESVLDQPRIDAIELARHKAEIYAAAADVEVGTVISISEVPGDTPILFRQNATDEAMPAPATAASADLAVAPGQLEFSVSVTVTFELV